MLKVEQLEKRYDGGFLLGPLDVTVASGSTVAVFGGNGAGKSTLFQLLTGNMDRTSGTAFWNDKKISPDAVDVKREMGYLPQESDLPSWVTPLEIISWCSSLHKLPFAHVNDALNMWDINPWRHRPLAACSHGMQKRVGLALATMHDPSFLILDEAFNALDIVHARSLENLIRNRANRGLTTLLSSHSPLQAASLTDQAWILNKGKLLVLDEWKRIEIQEKALLVEKHFFSNVL